MKFCGRCREKLPNSEFYERTDREYQLTSWCRRCYKENSHDKKTAVRILVDETFRSWRPSE